MFFYQMSIQKMALAYLYAFYIQKEYRPPDEPIAEDSSTKAMSFLNRCPQNNKAESLVSILLLLLVLPI